MKSNWPSVAHWALTLAPSCSTSRLTSRIRCGLFLTVWTPSGVSVVRRMKVGMGAVVSDRVGPRPARPDRRVRLDPDRLGHARRREGQLAVAHVDHDAVALADLAG